MSDLVRNLLIIGGGDGMGLWLAKRVFARITGVERITLADILPLAADRIADTTNPGQPHLEELSTLMKTIDVVRLDYTKTGDDLLAEWAPVVTNSPPPVKKLTLAEYDTVMLGVPEDAMETTAQALLPHLKAGTNVFDICSTKRLALPAMLKHAPPGVSVLGTHPLFGPAVSDLVGQIMVMVPTGQTDETFYRWYSNVVRSFGAVVEEMIPQNHDLYMLFIQTLTHFSYLVFGRTLAQAKPMGFDLAESFQLSTPPYGIMAAFTARLIGGNPRLYAQIQDQPNADDVRALFVKAAEELATQFSGDREGIQSAIQEVIDSYRGADVARAYANSRALVDSVQNSYRELYHRKESGLLTILLSGDPIKSGDPSVIHVGIVTDVDGQTVELLERVVLEAGKWFIAYDDESESTLRKIGRNVRSRKTRIARHNIRQVLTFDETLAWRRENLLHHQRDLAILTDRSVDIDYLCDVLVRVHPSVVAGSVHEPPAGAWLRRYGMQNKLLRVSIFGDRDADACLADVARSLHLFGIRTPEHGKLTE